MRINQRPPPLQEMYPQALASLFIDMFPGLCPSRRVAGASPASHVYAASHSESVRKNKMFPLQRYAELDRRIVFHSTLHDCNMLAFVRSFLFLGSLGGLGSPLEKTSTQSIQEALGFELRAPKGPQDSMSISL